MFTGLIEAVGTVARLSRSGRGARLAVTGVRWPHGEAPTHGDSVAVNGVCLTAIDPRQDAFEADLSPETLQRSLFGEIHSGDRVNLERALRLGDRLGGHLVQGHVDGVVRLLTIRDEGGFARWRISLPTDLAAEVAPKGSVTIHGVSLTASAVGGDWFEVVLIPETLSATTLGQLRGGARLHLETDVLAKYVARRLGDPRPSAILEMFGPEDGGA